MSIERKHPKQHTQTIEFLNESNNIENVWDQESLGQAIKAWDFIISKDQLSLETILETHRILMVGKLSPQNLGTLRKHSVWIGGREGKSWYSLPDLMENWLGSVNETVNNPPSSQNLIINQHVNFEIIHPLADGNGRMGRILMNWTLTKVGLPILIIKEKEKQQYYRWFSNN